MMMSLYLLESSKMNQINNTIQSSLRKKSDRKWASLLILRTSRRKSKQKLSLRKKECKRRFKILAKRNKSSRELTLNRINLKKIKIVTKLVYNKRRRSYSH
jgi:hypothetical protein